MAYMSITGGGNGLLDHRVEKDTLHFANLSLRVFFFLRIYPFFFDLDVLNIEASNEKRNHATVAGQLSP